MAVLAAEKLRMEPRVRAMVRARLRDSAGEREICIIDISTKGLLATAASPPVRGELVEITIGRNRLAGHVRWSGARRFGIALRERVSVAAMAEGGTGTVALAASVGQARARHGIGDALRANPQMLGRMVDFAVRLVAVGWIAFGIVSAAFVPLDGIMTRGD
ncbi:MAG: PilZ domain-containing protein [Pseudomonadota bacterium]